MGVSRQSVSKWEGAQSIPDIDKILLLSRIFEVSTDYLLKDELEDITSDNYVTKGSVSDKPQLRRVTMEEAYEYLSIVKAYAPRLALAVFFLVISPIALILLTGIAEVTKKVVDNGNSVSVYDMTPAALGIGLSVLTVLIAVEISFCIFFMGKTKAYAFLEKETFETEYGVTGMVKERLNEFSDKYTRFNLIGTVLCILSALPLFISFLFGMKVIVVTISVCLLLFYICIWNGILHICRNYKLINGKASRRRQLYTQK